MPGPAPGMPVSASGMPIPAAGMPVSSPGMPVSSPGMPVPGPGMPGGPIPDPMSQKQSIFSNAQVHQLRAQIVAYRLLARNQPIPENISLTLQGKRPPPIPPTVSQQPSFQRPQGLFPLRVHNQKKQRARLIYVCCF